MNIFEMFNSLYWILPLLKYNLANQLLVTPQSYW